MDMIFETVLLTGLSEINLIVGRNGSGKSRLLRRIARNFLKNNDYNISYISPERGGRFERNANVEYSADHDSTYVYDSRDRNTSENFKVISAARLRKLELTYLKQLQNDESIRRDMTRNFSNDCLNKINRLLQNISVNINEIDNELQFVNNNNEIVQSNEISSGEAEVLALSIEVLYFVTNLKRDKNNILLIDEPDVHLHPDLQYMIAQFVIGEISVVEKSIRDITSVIIATHSTPLLCAFSSYEYSKIGIKNFDNSNIKFNKFDSAVKKSAAFFAHPLSQSISNDPLFIVEGEDDVRVWQQAARTSQGNIKIFPCLAVSVDQQTDLEEFCSTILEALYDNPIAFSVRDGDGKLDKLDPIGSINRFRLNCYAVENILLTDESLEKFNSNWIEFKSKASEWIEGNSSNKSRNILQDVVNSEDRCRNKKIKEIRNIIMGIYGSKKPWEIHAGQVVGSIYKNSNSNPSEHSVVNYLGVNLLTALGMLDRSKGKEGS